MEKTILPGEHGTLERIDTALMSKDFDEIFDANTSIDFESQQHTVIVIHSD